MNEIFTVYVVADYFYDDEGERVKHEAENRQWIDSYWTTEAEALKEAERLWENDNDEFYEKITVFERKLNVRGTGTNEWDSRRDRIVKCWQ